MKPVARITVTFFLMLLILLIIPAALANTFTLPSQLKSVEEEAFYGDKTLGNVILPEGIERIEARAFANSSIPLIDLPASVKYIAEDAFDQASVRFVKAEKESYAYTWAREHDLKLWSDYYGWDPSSEEDVPEDPLTAFEYEIKSDGAYITAYTGNSSCIYIPSAIEGAKVVSIQLNPSQMFEYNFNVLNIVLPAQPIQIEDGAFYGFSNLLKIEGLENVISVGTRAFDYTSVTELVFSDKLSKISSEAFTWTGVQKLVVPDDVLYDEYFAFNTIFLKSLTLLDGKNAPTIMLKDGVLFSADEKTLLCYPCGKQCASYTIPEGTECIADGAFIPSSPLYEVIIPGYVTDLKERSFYNATSPTELVVEEGSAAHTYALDLVKRDSNFSIVLLSDRENTLNALIDRIVRENAASGSDYEKALALHDWLINHGEYDYRESGIAYYSGADMLRYGKGVCAAYADAYQMLLTAAGIESKKEGNSTHEFNAVKIGDEWMYVDCTWDDNDAGEKISHMYFGFEDTIRYYVYGSPSPTMFNNMIIDTDTTKTKQYKNHYWYKYGYCSDAIAEAGKEVEAQLRNGNLSFTKEFLPYGTSEETITGLLTAASVSNDVFNVDGTEFRVACSWSNGTLYCTVVNKESEASADDYVYDIKNNRIRILQYTGDEKDVTVPARINGMEVGCIGPAFYGNTKVVSVNLPDTVVEIEGNAFCNALSLRKVRFPMQLKEIGDNAFYQCISLSSDVILPSGVTAIGHASFMRCRSVRNVFLPAITDMGDMPFADCTALESVTLSEGLTKVSSSAFSGCKSLTSVTLPQSLYYLGGNAFYETGIRELTIPAKVEILGVSPIQNCYSLISLTVAADNPYYKSEDNIVFTKDGSMLRFSAPYAGREDYRIPDGVTSLDERAFCGNQTIKHLVIPGSVKKIGSEAFTGGFSEKGTALESVIIENGCEEIGYGSFYSCYSLTKLELPDSITSLGKYAFAGVPLEELHIPPRITFIPEGLFSSYVGKLYIHENVTGSDTNFAWLSEAISMVVYGKAGTYAETFAAENGLTFVPIV